MKVFGSRVEAADYYGVSDSSIGHAIKLKHNVLSPNNGKLVFEDYIEGKEYEFHENTKKPRSGTMRIICITTGEIFNSVREASIKYGFDRNRIYEALRNTNHAVNGYYFRRYDEAQEYEIGKTSSPKTPIYCITNGKHYDSLEETMKDCHVARKTIHSICNGLIDKSKNGYVFKYDVV